MKAFKGERLTVCRILSDHICLKSVCFTLHCTVNEFRIQWKHVIWMRMNAYEWTHMKSHGLWEGNQWCSDQGEEKCCTCSSCNILQENREAWVIWLKNHNRAFEFSFSSHICNSRAVFISECLTTTTSRIVALDPGAATESTAGGLHKNIRKVRTILVDFWSANKAGWKKTFKAVTRKDRNKYK